MKKSRLLFHVSGGVATILVAVAGIRMWRGQWFNPTLSPFLFICGQATALMAWPLINRSAKAGKSGISLGVPIVLLGHFSISFFVFVIRVLNGRFDPGVFLAFWLGSTIFTGWLGLPLCMFIAWATTRLRRNELVVENRLIKERALWLADGWPQETNLDSQEGSSKLD